MFNSKIFDTCSEVSVSGSFRPHRGRLNCFATSKFALFRALANFENDRRADNFLATIADEQLDLSKNISYWRSISRETSVPFLCHISKKIHECQ
jgi:hypothetical protein